MQLIELILAVVVGFFTTFVCGFWYKKILVKMRHRKISSLVQAIPLYVNGLVAGLILYRGLGIMDSNETIGLVYVGIFLVMLIAYGVVQHRSSSISKGWY